MTILVHGECFNLADIDDDKQHFVCRTVKFWIYIIFHQNNDGYDVVNDYESVMNSEENRYTEFCLSANSFFRGMNRFLRTFTVRVTQFANFS